MAQSVLQYRCNICGLEASRPVEQLDREAASCDRCGSCGRFRWIVHALSMELFGRSLLLPEFPELRCVKGLGLSDWAGYAVPLAEKFDYTNSFFHMEPRFDITSIGERHVGQYDFVIATEVLEHVRPPVQDSLRNLARILKPGGFVILTSPSYPAPVNLEHFPSLHDYRLVEMDSGWVLVNRRRDNVIETFDRLTFHGGPGSTLEMRVFSRTQIRDDLLAAGFEESEETAGSIEPLGIVLDPHCSLPMVARKAGGRDRRLWTGELAERIQGLRSSLEHMRGEIAQSESDLRTAHDHIRRLDRELEERAVWAQSLDRDLVEARIALESTQRDLAAQTKWAQDLSVESERDRYHIAHLERERDRLERDLKTVLESRWWRLRRRLPMSRRVHHASGA